MTSLSKLKILSKQRIMADPSDISSDNQLINVMLSGESGLEEKENRIFTTSQEERSPLNQNEMNPYNRQVQELEKELADLKLKLRLYEEPPNFDLDKYSIVVDGTKKTKSTVLGVGGHVRYCINVKNPSMKSSLKVFRRFNDWVALEQILKQEFPYALLPKRPSKKLGLLGSNLDPQFIELRSFQLHAYLQCLARHPRVRMNQCFRKFLFLPSEQWEELIGSVTSLDPTLRVETAKRAQNDFGEHIWKGLEETGKTLWDSIGVFGSVTRQRNKLQPGSTGDSHTQSINQLFEKFLFVQVDEVNFENEDQQVKRWPQVLGDATNSLMGFSKRVDTLSQNHEELVVSCERLSMAEGRYLGQELFNMLTAFSQALHKSYVADQVLVKKLVHKVSVELDHPGLLQALQQSTLMSLGADDLHKRMMAVSNNTKPYDLLEKSLRSELNETAFLRSRNVADSLEKFVQHQIDNARAKIRCYSSFLDSFREEEFV